MLASPLAKLKAPAVVMQGLVLRLFTSHSLILIFSNLGITLASVAMPARAMTRANTICRLCMYDSTIPAVAEAGSALRNPVAPPPTTALGSRFGTLIAR